MSKKVTDNDIAVMRKLFVGRADDDTTSWGTVGVLKNLLAKIDLLRATIRLMREEREAHFQELRAQGCGDPDCVTHRENKYGFARTKAKTISEHFRNKAEYYFKKLRRDGPGNDVPLTEHELFLMAVEFEAAYWMGRQDEWRLMSVEVPSAVGDEPYRGTENP